VRLTTLLDTVDQAGSGPWPPIAPAGPATSAVPSLPTKDQFDALVAGLIPCRSNDPELWFAERTAEVEAAKALCRQCPLLEGCLAGALDRHEPWGVWGGEVFVGGEVVAVKRGRGRPRKNPAA
jgi:WhiB family transcriptional regulator, redox-sensing transcriptional regulator